MQGFLLAAEGVGMTLGLVGGRDLQRGFGHDGAQTSILGLFVEEDQLLARDRDLRVGLFDPFGEIEESPFDGCPRHGGSVRRVRSGILGVRCRTGRCGQNAWVAAHPIFTPEHEELRASVRRFVASELRPHVEEWEALGFFPDSVFRRCGELGFLGLHYPSAWGGSDGDLAASLLFIEELGRCGSGSIPMAVAVQTHMCTPAIAEFGTDALRER